MEKIKLWTDGGVRGNQNENNIGAYAYHLEYWVNNEILHQKDFSEGEYNTTNNIQEMKAVLEGLKAIKNKDIRVEVYLDSAYTLNGITSWINNWKQSNWINSSKKPVANRELWEELDKEKSMFREIEFIKVKGHSGENGNELVDSLLNKCMDDMKIEIVKEVTEKTKVDNIFDINRIYCEDCFVTMQRMIDNGVKVNNVITSPFYNTGRGSKCHNTQKSRDNHEGRYDVHLDDMTDEEYIEFTIKLFEHYDKILEENGCILYNINYGTENTHLMWLVIAEIIKRTNFTIADDIIWKKKSALPNNVSSNKLTRIVEHVFVFCRKSEFKTFEANKEVTSVRATGQKMYANIYNFIEAKNNDGSNKLNKATYSTDLIMQLLNIYVKPNALVYDSFMGTGTTANACILYGCNYIGSELSQDQCNFAEERLKNTIKEMEGNQNE